MRLRRPASLRDRLIVALLLALLGALVLWLAGHTMMLGRQQTGWWDSSLRVVAHQILQSLPQDVERLSSERPYRLPEGVQSEGVAEGVTVHGDKISFQVWAVGGRNAFRSPGSPLTPLRPDFGAGFADVEIGGQIWRVYAVSDAEHRVQVQVGRSQDQLDAEQARWLRLGLWVAGAIFLLLAGAVAFVVCWSLRPVNAVRAAIERRHALDLTPLPTAGLPCEVAPMVDSFNRLLQRLDGALQGERRFIADAAHELRTPLAALQAHTELALHSTDAQASRAALWRLAEVVQRSSRLAEQLLDLARLDSAHRSERRLALYEVVEVVVRDFELACAQRGQRITLSLDASEIVGDVDALGTLVRNLVDNALRYGGERARVVVSCEGDAREVRLQVADDGPGVPASLRERIFDRFVRVPGRGGRGSGIGLSIVARIAELHGARLDAGLGLDGRGFAVTLRFAAAPAAAPATPPPASPRPVLAAGVRQR